DLRDEKQVADDALKPLRVAIDRLEEPHLLFSEILVLGDQLEVAPDRRQRRAQLVRDERDELVLHAVELPELVVLPLELELRLAARSDVDNEAARIASVSFDDGDRGVVDPDNASVAPHHAVLVVARVTALLDASHLGE